MDKHLHANASGHAWQPPQQSHRQQLLQKPMLEYSNTHRKWQPIFALRLPAPQVQLARLACLSNMVATYVHIRSVHILPDRVLSYCLYSGACSLTFCVTL